MKHIASLSVSHLTVHTEERPVALAEIEIVTAEPEFYFDETGELAKRRACHITRFHATTAELRQVASTLALWADERDALESPPLPLAVG